MNLVDLVNDLKTDKNTSHSYLQLYNQLLLAKKNSAQNVLEIGIGDFGEKNGGSIKLWRDYFTNAKIFGLDILPITRVMDELINDSRVVLYTETDAYNEDFFITHFLNKNIRFDFMLDDGPHTLESMKQFIKVYDLRSNKNRYDDIVFTIDKSKCLNKKMQKYNIKLNPTRKFSSYFHN